MMDSALFVDLRAHATQTGDAALQAQVQPLETALAHAGDLTGSTAVALGSDIQILVHQTTNLPIDLLTRLLALADTLSQRAAETLDATGHTLRVFLASPGDVKDERRLALKAIEKLQTDPLYKSKLTLEAVAWDKPDDQTPLLAGLDPQSAITQGLPLPSECDVFVGLFWSRMGTPLDTARYTKPEGGPYRSGTEWELEEALKAYKAQGRPRVLVYRRTEKISLDPDAADFDEKVRQRKTVKDFFASFINPDGSIRSGYNEYASPSEFGETFEQHLRKVLAQLIEERQPKLKLQTPASIASVAPTAWPKDQSPFPGLRAFGEKDAPVFFGRGAETDQLLRRLGDAPCRFLAVVGASGSGKSSLVGAGLIPRLRAGALPGSEGWPILTFTPDALGQGDPFDSLTNALVASLRLPLRELGERLRATPTGLRDVLQAHLARAPEWQRAVLFIDQFEETFTRVPDEAVREAFCAALDEAARSPRVLMVVALRDDFYRYCVQSPMLSRLINTNGGAFNLSAPGPLELHEMMTGPARVAGLEFEVGLVRQLLTDTGTDSGALALLAYALDQLYEKSAGQGVLTSAAYHAFEGVQGAIGARAQATFESLPPSAQATLPRVFRELVEVDESGAATRKRVPLAQIQADADCAQLVQALVQARLLVTSKSTGDDPLVEVAHEALFRNWPRLKAWIESAQDDLILLRQVRAAAAWWAGHGRQAAFLWPDERLQLVYQMQGRLMPELNAVEKEFTRSEYDRLQEELEKPAISHTRRLAIGERFNQMDDRRPGVGLIRDRVGLEDRRGLAENETRLWGDKPEHLGLPGMIWIKVYSGNSTYNTVLPFYIAKYPVTYTQFQAFIDAPDGFTNPRWWQSLVAEADYFAISKPGEQNFKFGNHPRETVSWYDSIAFCRWLNARLGWPDIPVNLTMNTLGMYTGLRLLTEWEWQRAASPQRESYPWGDEWDSTKANTSESGLRRTTAVGLYPTGMASSGVLDMSGNVWEWCLNQHSEPTDVGVMANDDVRMWGVDTVPKQLHRHRSSLAIDSNVLLGVGARVLRGGAWASDSSFARADSRLGYQPDFRHDFIGLRLCVRHTSLESLPTESLPTESLPTESLPTELLPTESLPTESLTLPTLSPSPRSGVKSFFEKLMRLLKSGGRG